MNLRPETERHFNNILDTFTGADGGGSFWNFKLLVEQLDVMAADGYKTAQSMLDAMYKFSRLLEVANGKPYKDDGKFG